MHKFLKFLFSNNILRHPRLFVTILIFRREHFGFLLVFAWLSLPRWSFFFCWRLWPHVTCWCRYFYVTISTNTPVVSNVLPPHTNVTVLFYVIAIYFYCVKKHFGFYFDQSERQNEFLTREKIEKSFRPIPNHGLFRDKILVNSNRS